MIQLYELYIDTVRLYAFTIIRLYPLLLFTLSAKKLKFTNVRFCGFTVNFANLPFYAPKAARPDRKFTNLPFYGAFLGTMEFTIFRFYRLRRALAKDVP